MTDYQIDKLKGYDLDTLRRVLNHYRRVCDDLRRHCDEQFDLMREAADDPDVTPFQFEIDYMRPYEYAMAQLDLMRDVVDELETIHDGMRMAVRF